MKKYILTLDEGTTSARAIIFDNDGNIVSLSQNEFTQIYPQAGYVEHNPVEILSAQYSAITECIIKSGITADKISAVGITNQRETVVLWNKHTGEPIHNAIVWQCRRTADICEQLKKDGYEQYISDTTGLKIDAYFSGTKIKWLLDNIAGAREAAQNGDLLFGTVDTWLMWKLSGGKIHATDQTNASRTMLYDIHNLCWDKNILHILGIPECMLPTVQKSGSIYGDIDIMGAKLSVCGVAGDQQSALFGQHCVNSGDLKNTYGTGCFLLMNTGEKAVASQNGLLTTIAATVDNSPTQYALEGSVFIGGAVIQWLRDEMKLIENAAQSEICANAVSDSAGLYIVPAFSGLGAPYWDMYARGTICGLTRGTSRNHIVRAGLESIAYQTNDLITAMQNDAGFKVTTLKADGGAARNNFLMQFQSDISNLQVSVPENAEATALGAALLAGITAGVFDANNDIKKINSNSTVFNPKIEDTTRSELLNGWQRAVKSTIKFSEE